jgi:ABC-2 type transport system permease protein
MIKLGPIAATVLKELRQRRWLLMGYTITALVFTLMYASVYPSIHEQSSQFTQLFNSYPKAFLDAFGIGQVNMSTFEGYLAMEHYSLVWPMMAALIAISFAAGALSGEIEKGTATMLLSLPVSRLKLFFAKYFAGAVAVAIFTIITIYSAVPAGLFFGIDLDPSRLVAVIAPCLTFAFAIYGLAIAASSYFSDRGRVYMVLGGGLLFMYVINIISGLSEPWEWLKYLSLFNYYTALDIIAGDPIDLWAIAVLAAVAILGAILGALRFNRRDIAV